MALTLNLADAEDADVGVRAEAPGSWLLVLIEPLAAFDTLCMGIDCGMVIGGKPVLC